MFSYLGFKYVEYESNYFIFIEKQILATDSEPMRIFYFRLILPIYFELLILVFERIFTQITQRD